MGEDGGRERKDDGREAMEGNSFQKSPQRGGRAGGKEREMIMCLS